MAYRNHEGYPDPTAGEAIARVSLEERRLHRRDLLNVAEQVIHGRSIDGIARRLDRSPEDIRHMLVELRAAVDRRLKEVYQ